MQEEIRFILEEVGRINDEIQTLIFEREQLLDALDRLVEIENEERDKRLSFKKRWGIEGFRGAVNTFFGEGLRRDAERFFGLPR